MVSKSYFTPELNIFHSVHNPEFGTLSWYPVIMVKFGTFLGLYLLSEDILD